MLKKLFFFFKVKTNEKGYFLGPVHTSSKKIKDTTKNSF